MISAMALDRRVLLLQGRRQAPAMTWPEATELLQRERLAGEVCARVVKRIYPRATWRR